MKIVKRIVQSEKKKYRKQVEGIKKNLSIRKGKTFKSLRRFSLFSPKLPFDFFKQESKKVKNSKNSVRVSFMFFYQDITFECNIFLNFCGQ